MVNNLYLVRASCLTFYLSGALGAGLAIFTRYPVIESEMNPYSLNGQPLDVAGGDWFVGKGAAHLVILHPILGQVQVFNTHVCLLSPFSPIFITSYFRSSSLKEVNPTSS